MQEMYLLQGKYVWYFKSKLRMISRRRFYKILPNDFFPRVFIVTKKKLIWDLSQELYSWWPFHNLWFCTVGGPFIILWFFCYFFFSEVSTLPWMQPCISVPEQFLLSQFLLSQFQRAQYLHITGMWSQVFVQNEI